MARLVVEEQKDFPTLPDDSILHLKVDTVGIRTIQGRNEPFDKLEFKFKVLGILHVPTGDPSQFADMIGEQIFGSCSPKMTESPENKARNWSEAILGRVLPLGFELDTDYLVGREVRGVTSQYDKRAINPVTGKPYRGHQVHSLLPMGEIQSVQQQPAQQPVQQPQPQYAGQPQTWASPQPQQAQQGWQQAQQQHNPDPWAPPVDPSEPGF